MIKSLTNAVNVAQEQTNNIVMIEAQLQDIYRKFPLMSSGEQKKISLERYFDLLNERENCEAKINEVIRVMSLNINNLGKIKLNFIDKMAYKMKIKEMEKMLANSTEITENIAEQVLRNQQEQEDFVVVK